jgi:3-hydroxyisobutyrate dehydrogenase-like beta-hydroxyacid dehydrogenase
MGRPTIRFVATADARADGRPAPGGPVVAVLGLGEAGSAIAGDLAAAGAVVRGFDPLDLAVPGVLRCRDDADACAGCAVVVSLTCAHEAEGALAAALPAMPRDAIYADLNTASPGQKAALAALAATAGRGFADVALMAPVPGNGLRTPMLASGPAAGQFAALFTGLGARVDVLPGPPGTAAARKLVRSVFYKGMAAAVTEALRAAAAAGCEDWLRDNIRHELTSSSAATLDRLERGSVQHAVRRTEEMAAAAQMLTELGVPARIASASEQWLRQLAAEQAARDQPG